MNTTPVTTKTGFTEQYLKPEDGVKRIRTLGKGRAIFLMVEQRAMITEDTYLPVSGTVRITRAVAMKFVQDNYMHTSSLGGHVKLVWSENCLFIA